MPTTRFVGATGLEGVVPALKRLTFYYCEQSNSSKWLRSYLLQHLVPLARSRPHTEFAVSRRTNKHPVLRAEYLNGYTKVVPLSQAVTRPSKAKDEWEHAEIALHGPRGIMQQIQVLMDSAGLSPQRFRKQTLTRVPLTETRGGLAVGNPFSDAPIQLQNAHVDSTLRGTSKYKSWPERTIVEDFGTMVRTEERARLQAHKGGVHPSVTKRYMDAKKQKKATSILERPPVAFAGW